VKRTARGMYSSLACCSVKVCNYVNGKTNKIIDIMHISKE
jgi:hypothetical protein